MERAQDLNPSMGPYGIASLGYAYISVGRFEDAAIAYRKAIARDPTYWPGYGGLSKSLEHKWFSQETSDPRILDQAIDMAERAVDLDANSSSAHLNLGSVYLAKRSYAEAIAITEKAIAIRPESARAYAQLSDIFSYSGNLGKATEMMEKARRRDPLVTNATTLAYRLSDQHGKAISTARQCLSLNLLFLDLCNLRLEMTILYGELGRIEEAIAEAKELLTLVPHFSVDVWGERNPMKDRSQVERDMAALRKAGLK